MVSISARGWSQADSGEEKENVGRGKQEDRVILWASGCSLEWSGDVVPVIFVSFALFFGSHLSEKHPFLRKGQEKRRPQLSLKLVGNQRTVSRWMVSASQLTQPFFGRAEQTCLKSPLLFCLLLNDSCVGCSCREAGTFYNRKHHPVPRGQPFGNPGCLKLCSALFPGKMYLVSIDVTIKHVPVTKYSLTFVRWDGENTLDGKERHWYWRYLATSNSFFFFLICCF